MAGSRVLGTMWFLGWVTRDMVRRVFPAELDQALYWVLWFLAAGWALSAVAERLMSSRAARRELLREGMGQ